ncbi:MAG: hypothetical protein JXA57_13555 [Armatimonadetes bacterium]|nr:hypothetical protein [Armatimonadota bacterium]
MKQLACLLVVGAFLCSSSAFAQHSQRLALGKDNSAKISGTIQGKEYADYLVPVGAG